MSLEIDNNLGLVTKEESKKRLFCLVCMLTFIQFITLNTLLITLKNLLYTRNDLVVNDTSGIYEYINHVFRELSNTYSKALFIRASGSKTNQTFVFKR